MKSFLFNVILCWGFIRGYTQQEGKIILARIAGQKVTAIEQYQKALSILHHPETIAKLEKATNQ